MDIPNGNWIFSYLPYPDYRIGSKLIYECEDSYKAIGSTEIECLPSGYWSDYAPKCLPKGEKEIIIIIVIIMMIIMIIMEMMARMARMARMAMMASITMITMHCHRFSVTK